MPAATSLRELFLLDPEVVFLNHGSFGACPRPVFEEYQRWQVELERQPVEFLARRYPELVDRAKALLAEHVGADPANLVFVPNATSGLDMVVRSLSLGPDDEVLTTDHEYGAVDLLWTFVCAKTGARLVRPALTAGPSLVDDVWEAVTPRTRVLCFSHITSRTALVFPAAELCRRARAAGILTVVDGAHAPGQIPVELETLGADVYVGNCHKWLCAPKGAGFAYVRPEHHAWVEPPVVSWGWGEDGGFAERLRWQGTLDPAAWLAVPAAIDFQAEHGWEAVRGRCHDLADAARLRLAGLTGLEPLAPDASWLGQMVAVPLPRCEPEELQRRLYAEHRIEAPVRLWRDVPLLRLSFQAYNDEGDLERVTAALGALL